MDVKNEKSIVSYLGKALDMVFDMRDNLHLLARNNGAAEIREFTSTRHIDEVKMACMKHDEAGNTPPMTAALYNKKEALLALLGPFFVIPHDEDIDKLLHHRNKAGQSLLAIVVLHMESLFAAHGLLVEFEAAAHNWDSFEVEKCFRTTLGSSKGAAATLELFRRIEVKQQPKSTKVKLALKIFTHILLIRSFFMVFDVTTDIMLLFEYYDGWENHDFRAASLNNIVYPGFQVAKPQHSPCLRAEHIATGTGFNGTHYIYNDYNTSLRCYSRAISDENRFKGTLLVILLPFLFYFFELLRFRTFSTWIEAKINAQSLNCCVYYALYKPFKLIVNLALLLTWPIVSFFRQAFFQLRYEASESFDKVGRHRQTSRLAKTIGSRTQIIEVCTEASLQPLLQLYLVLANLFVWNNEKSVIQSRTNNENIRQWVDQFEAVLEFVTDEEKRRMVSALASILAVAASYTSQYRHNKEQSVGIIPTTVYFAYICLAVVNRILCFEMFAFFLGPGKFHIAMAAVAFHILLMTLIHFVFSDSVKQCKRRDDQLIGGWWRQLLLVVHNCLLNGLANIYIHNNLEIFVRYDNDKKPAKLEEEKSRKKSVGYEGASYAASDIRQRTLVRQFVVDAIMLAENIAMLYLAKDTVTSTTSFKSTYWIIVVIAVSCYLAAMCLKFMFYWSCHPWSKLIRPRKCSAGAELVVPTYESSTVMFSRQVNCAFGGPDHLINITFDPAQDRLRHNSTMLTSS